MADPNFAWTNIIGLPSRSYQCGFCDNRVASAVGFNYKASTGHVRSWIYICPHCANPTFFGQDRQLPSSRPGASVTNLPADVAKAYNEARDCVAASAFTGAAMLCRKLLMHLSVQCGATGNLTFQQHVQFLVNAGYVPPQGKGWVDHIRDKGNEVNHELVFANADDARDLIGFVEMLLKFNYEFPGKVGSQQPAAATPSGGGAGR